MFPFSALNKNTPAPEVTQIPAKTNELHPLDALTGGAFSAHTSSERTARIRDWLAGAPSAEQMQAVFKELSGKDKGAAKLLREKLDEIKRSKGQESIAQEWADKAQELLAQKDVVAVVERQLPEAARAVSGAPGDLEGEHPRIRCRSGPSGPRRWPRRSTGRWRRGRSSSSR